MEDSQRVVRLLMVEDNVEHLDLCKEYLPKDQFIIDAALTSTEAIEKLKKNKYDLIVLDYALPDFDGIELLRRIKPMGLKVPIIFTTVCDDAYISFEAMKGGACDYVVKTFHYYKTLKDRILENLDMCKTT
ncbi:MAG: response regulator [Methanomassiliicoccales archaeon]|jgi:DNA-binding response OmpR family regulator